MEEQLIPDILTFEDVTEGIRVAVQSYFLSDQSAADENKFVWAYRIRISNESELPTKLLSRHWIITNGRGERQEVVGDGVIGEQPLIQPGDEFTYTSGCPLATPTGFMHGSYQMIDSNDRKFTVAIPAFSLDSPYCSPNIN
jgi:ApaG protein